MRTDYRDCNDSRLIFLLYGSSLFWLVLTSQDKFFEGLSTNHRLLSTPPPIWWSLNSRFCCYGIMILVKTSLRFLAFQLLTFCLSSEPLGTAQESANASRGKVLQKSRPTSRGFSEILGPQTLACLVAPNIKLYVPRTMSLLKSYPFLWLLAPLCLQIGKFLKGKRGGENRAHLSAFPFCLHCWPLKSWQPKLLSDVFK